MYDVLNDELAALKEQIQVRERTERQLDACRKELAQARELVSQLEADLSHHDDVLKKLHGLSFTHLLAVIRGIEDEQEQELHQRVASINARRTSAKLSVSRLEEDERALDQELAKISMAKNEYDRLLAEKERQIAEGDNKKLGQQLLGMVQRLGDIRSQVKETGEALGVGQQAAVALVDCLRSLEKARNWGTWDMLGGGTLTTMVKRSHMDDAQGDMNHANYYLRRLKRELQDVHGVAGETVDLNPGGFLHFADYFFDDLFVDWAVQNQINRGIDAVSIERSKVESVIEQLNLRIRSLERDQAAVEEEKRRLIEEAR